MPRAAGAIRKPLSVRQTVPTMLGVAYGSAGVPLWRTRSLIIVLLSVRHSRNYNCGNNGKESLFVLDKLDMLHVAKH